MTNIGDTNINFLDLRNKWSQSNFVKSDGSSGSGPGTTDISLSSFRDALFTNGTSVPTGNGEISIDTHFKNKVFGTSGSGSESESEDEDINYTTDLVAIICLDDFYNKILIKNLTRLCI